MYPIIPNYQKRNKQPYNLIALVDSGATNCLINYDTYKSINQYKQFPLQETSYILNLAEKDNTLKVKGQIRAICDFNDNKNNNVEICLQFLVIGNLLLNQKKKKHKCIIHRYKHK